MNSNTLNKYFDKVVCINLKKRDDRWLAMQQQFIHAGFDINDIIKYDAVENNPMAWIYVPSHDPLDYIKPDSWPGAAGCMASHIGVWKMARERGWRNVLVVEDDCDFVPGVADLFANQILQVPEDWDLLYLGGVHQTKGGRFLPELVSFNILKCKRLITTTCYAIRDTCYDFAINTIMEKDPEFYTAVDTYLASRIQPKTNSYAFHPPLTLR